MKAHSFFLLFLGGVWYNRDNYGDERLVPMAVKKKPPVLHKNKQNEAVNKKALVWTGVGIGAIIVLMTILLIVNQA
jgi:hypothetical protein